MTRRYIASGSKSTNLCNYTVVALVDPRGAGFSLVGVEVLGGAAVAHGHEPLAAPAALGKRPGAPLARRQLRGARLALRHFASEDIIILYMYI